ncbi:MAG: UPF0149 family protein [Burkholderiales bacterium]|nr:UPF0149 family protein [Burkholderiales bacterium]
MRAGTAQAPFGDAEVDRLEALAGTGKLAGRAMLPDELQGFLCAVVSAPQPIPEAVWMPIALGVDPADEEVAASGIVPLVRRLADECERDLLEERGIEPILAPGPGGQGLDYARWARGYLEGVSLAEPAWDAADPEAAHDLVLPFLALAGDATPAERHACAGLIGLPEGADLDAALEEDLAALVQENFEHWLRRRLVPDPIRRASPRVGRNDPCTCGSGRKYKQCCGKDA